ncbi:MAG: DegT/DnrJ/EryC1/StrS aminotransferase family protein [Helicobacter sp.]|nr:DegT/DnrJ/EryC1/StrS aminotransferase family protein [Helicobacter sp.]
MKKRQIPFCVLNISDDEMQAVLEALKRGEEVCRYVERLEDAFAEFIDTSYSIATADGTSALHLALAALGVRRGDRVICSVNCHPFVPEVIRHFDSIPLLVDIHPDDYNLQSTHCEELLREQGARKIKAIIVSHIAGNAADLEAFYDLKYRYGVPIIDDATMALGLHYHGRRIGSLESDATIFSFAFERPGALANGGMIVTKNQSFAHKMRLLRHHAITREEYVKNRPSYMYDIIDRGYRYDTTQLNAAFCLAQLRKIDSMTRRRQEIAALYTKQLEGIAHITTPSNPQSIYSAYIVRVAKNRDNMARELSAAGIATDLHFVPIHLLSYYKNKYSFKVSQFSNALNNYQRILSLPIYSCLRDDEVLYVCEQIRKINQKWTER